MMALLADYFLWFRALHIIAVFAWMAALFYLPRLFVYHSVAPVGGEISEQFKVMERRLAGVIMWPSALASWGFGILTAAAGGYIPDVPGWLWLKLGFVLVLTIVHGLLHRFTGDFGADRRDRGQRFFRILNEVPTIALIGAVIMVVFKPLA
jgi:protoporphyrinogen IX oxidase